MGSLRIQKASGAPIRPEELSDSDGEVLVRLARRSVESYLLNRKVIKPPEDLDPKLLRPGAAFVTIDSVESGGRRELRGCIGAIRPVEPLAVTVIKVAVDAAVNDPRFPPMKPEELDKVVFEVTVLGLMEPLPEDPSLRPQSIIIGVHGLYVEMPPFSGLLLPQVAVEEGWDAYTFLTWTCIKAGLPGTCWLRRDVRVYRFTAAIWGEVEPKGPVKRRILS